MFPSTDIRWYRVKFSIYLGRRCIRRSITKANTNICTHLEQFLLSVSSICHLRRQYQYICISNDKVVRLPHFHHLRIERELAFFSLSSFLIFDEMNISLRSWTSSIIVSFSFFCFPLFVLVVVVVVIVWRHKKESVEYYCSVSSIIKMMVNKQSFIHDTNCHSCFILSFILLFFCVCRIHNGIHIVVFSSL